MMPDWNLAVNCDAISSINCGRIELMYTLLSDKLELRGDGDGSGCMPLATSVINGASSIYLLASKITKYCRYSQLVIS